VEIWKKQELRAFSTAFRTAEDEVRGPYLGMCHIAAKLIFSSKSYSETSFEDKRLRLRQGVQTISISGVEDGDVLRELAIAWAEVNLHADRSDDDWFEASVDYILQLGNYSESRSGLDSFLWHRELGVHLCIWTHGMLDRLYGGKGEKVERLLRDRTDDDTHQTLARLRCAPNMLGGLGQFVDSKKAQKQWISSGGYFFGRLLFTHALCTGISHLEDEGGLWPNLSAVNGAIAAWPYPLVKDREFTFSLIKKMRSPHYVPEVEQGNFRSEVWCQRLLNASRTYLESFEKLFCEGDVGDLCNADAWKQMGTALQVFSEMVLVYDIDEYRKS